MTFEVRCDIIFLVSERKSDMKNKPRKKYEVKQAMKPKTVKIYGPWVNGHRTVREISSEEWSSYTPLNNHANRLIKVNKKG